MKKRFTKENIKENVYSRTSAELGLFKKVENSNHISSQEWYVKWKKGNQIKQLWEQLGNRIKKKRVLEYLSIMKQIWQIKRDLRINKRSQSVNTSNYYLPEFKVIKLIRCLPPDDCESEKLNRTEINCNENIRMDYRQLKSSELSDQSILYKNYYRSSVKPLWSRFNVEQ